MTIVRRKTKQNFSIIANDAARDTCLNGEQLGMLYYLLTQPHDWHVRVRVLQRRLHWGRDKTYRVLNSLVELGYIERTQEREARTGMFERVEYIVYDEPVATPHPEKTEAEPLPDFPLPDLPKAAKEQSKDLNKILPPPPYVTSGDNSQDGLSKEGKPRSSNAAQRDANGRQQGAIEMQIAERLGPNGLEILMGLSAEHFARVIGLHLKGTLDAVQLEELRLHHRSAGLPRSG